MRAMLTIGLISGLALSVASCASEKPAATLPTALVLNDASNLSVDATSMEVVVDRPPPRQYPSVGYRSPITFQSAIDTWAHTHFQLTGKAVDKIRVRLRRGDITEKLLPVEHGIAGWFKKDQAAEYSGELSVSVIILDASGRVLSSADGSALDRRTVVEGTTDAEKRLAWAGMIKTMFDNLDREFLPNLRRGMAAYIH